MKKLLTAIAVACTSLAYAQQPPVANTGTEETVRRVADAVIKASTFKFVNNTTKEKFDSTTGLAQNTAVRAESGYNRWGYPNGVLTIGLMQLAAATGDKKYSDYAQRNAAFIFDNLP